MKAYKWVVGKKPIYGSGTYDLSGEWMEVEGTLILCVHGYHTCAREQVPHWCGTELWEVEIAGDVRDCGDKYISRRLRFVRKLRWNRSDAVDYALWCARRAATHAAKADAARDAATSAREAAKAAEAADVAREAAKAAAKAIDAAKAADAAIDAAKAADAAIDAAKAAVAARDAATFAAWDTHAADEERTVQLRWIERRVGEKLV